MRWKALIEMEKQQQEQVDRNIKEAREKLELELEAARHEHQVMLMRQGENRAGSGRCEQSTALGATLCWGRRGSSPGCVFQT